MNPKLVSFLLRNIWLLTRTGFFFMPGLFVLCSTNFRHANTHICVLMTLSINSTRFACLNLFPCWEGSSSSSNSYGLIMMSQMIPHLWSVVVVVVAFPAEWAASQVMGSGSSTRPRYRSIHRLVQPAGQAAIKTVNAEENARVFVLMKKGRGRRIRRKKKFFGDTCLASYVVHTHSVATAASPLCALNLCDDKLSPL